MNASGTYSLQDTLVDTIKNDTGLTVGTVYFYKLAAVNRIGESGLSAPVFDTTIPPAPTSLLAVAQSSSKIQTTWQKQSCATSYNIYRSTSLEGVYAITGTATDSIFTDTGITAGARLFYKVTARNGAGESDASLPASATTTPSTPSTPVVTPLTSTTVSIAWQSAGGATSYKVYRSTTSTSQFSLVYTLTDTATVDTGLSASLAYYYKVSSVNASGEGSQSSAGNTVTYCSVPTGANAVGQSTTSILISWPATTGAASYKLYQSTTSGGTFAVVGTPTSTTFTDQSLSAGTTYYYKVSAVNGAGETPLSAEVNGATYCATTTVTVAAISSDSLNVTWSAVAGATSYKVYRSTTSTGTYTQVGSPAATSYRDGGLTAGSTYYYKVSSVNASGEGSQSSAGNTVTYCSVPTGANAVGQSTTSILISWPATTGAASYKLYQSTTSGGTFAVVGTPTSTTFTDQSLSAGTTYYYKVSTVNGAGETPLSAEVNGATYCATTTVSVAAISSDSLNVTWSAVAGATSYKAYRSTTSTGTYTQVASPAATSYRDGGLSAGTTYYYKISAVNASGIASQSSAGNAATYCAAPATVTTTAQSSSSIAVAWTASSGATSYSIYRSGSASGTYTNIGSTSASPYTDGGLTAHSTYYYKVSAGNAAGESSLSSYAVETVPNYIAQSAFSSNLTLLKSASPYTISEPVTMAAGVRLTIEAGVEVRFAQNTSLITSGEIIAIGTKLDPILFTSALASRAIGDYRGIKINNDATQTVYAADSTYQSGTTFRYCNFQYGGGLYSDNRAVDVRYCSFSQCAGYPYVPYSETAALYVETHSNLSIVFGCTFNNNRGRSITMRGDATGLIDSCIFLNTPSLFQNGGCIVRNSHFESMTGNPIWANDGGGIVSGCTFLNNSTAISAYSCGIAFRKCLFKNMANGAIDQGCCSGGAKELTDCSFYNVGAIAIIGPGPFTRNNFVNDATQYVVKIIGITDADATNNYWGGLDSTAIAGRVIDYYDGYDVTKGKVTFMPMSNAPSLTAPLY
jgi:fibronectin type 3 domain-containing protein